MLCWFNLRRKILKTARACSASFTAELAVQGPGRVETKTSRLKPIAPKATKP